ncbi:MAG: hypothetical protein QGH20_00310 [Candidatus Latescibacteria bacterium]|nr:hypothetical protein [Candidatus Latescibacterota bacterium]
MVKWTGAKEGVRTDADALVNIAGGLRAVGTQSDSIRFLPGFAGKWRGIEVWSNPLIIQGDSANTAADTKLSYVRISGVDAPHDAKGGPLIVSSSANSTTFEMNHSVFSDNKGFYGGLSLRWVRTAEICSSTFTGNTATVGGGVYITGGSDINFVACAFTDNTARFGGGIFLHQGYMSLVGSVVARNTAIIEGAGIDVGDM